MTMTKTDIVSRIYKEVGFSKKEAAELVDMVFKLIKETLSRGEKVKISGFGNFSIRDKTSRTGRNPQTGESMEIPARRVLSFRPSHVLKEDISKKYEHRIGDDGIEDESISIQEGKPKALSVFTQDVEEWIEDEEDFRQFWRNLSNRKASENHSRTPFPEFKKGFCTPRPDHGVEFRRRFRRLPGLD